MQAVAYKRFIGGEGRYVDFEVMCTKWRKSPKTLGVGDMQVHINPDLTGTGTVCHRSGIHGLRLWHGEVFQCPLVKGQKGFQGLMRDRERAVGLSTGGSADCNIASEQIESYVKLGACLAGTSESPWHRLLLIRCDEKLRSFKAWTPFFKPPNRKLRIKKGTGDFCWCT